ncbi:hypothetical protein L0152_07325 [bacterium]|nr:hypothetical protein [bacterium]
MFTFICPKCKRQEIHWTGKPIICGNPTCNAPFKTLRREYRRQRAKIETKEFKEDKKAQFKRYNEEAPNVRIPREAYVLLQKYLAKSKALGKKLNRKDVLAEAVLEYLKRQDLK